MYYYKIIKDGEFIGLATSCDMRRYQTKHNILLCCDETEAQYVQLDVLRIYHAGWMWKETVPGMYPAADVIAINEAEYNTIREATANGEDYVEKEEFEDNLIESIEASNDAEYIQVTMDYLKQVKIQEMSNACSKCIQDGFDTVLSDGQIAHFSLTAQDQLNFITLTNMIQQGAEMVPYHSDGELCRYYSAADVNIIVSAATQYKTYHITYFNSLKHYILAIEALEELKNVRYGTVIPAEYKSDVLLEIEAAVGGEL